MFTISKHLFSGIIEFGSSKPWKVTVASSSNSTELEKTPVDLTTKPSATTTPPVWSMSTYTWMMCLLTILSGMLNLYCS